MGFSERFLRTEQNVQLSYELSQRIYTAAPYPTPAPNGSSIVICGHDQGARVIWRGGRTFKPAAAPKANGNGASNNAVMIIDSDDEAPAGVEEDAEFEDEEAETDPSRPFPPVLQHIDLVFGTSVTHLAVCVAVQDRIVFAATCGDSSVRLVSLPITPPSPERKAGNKSRKWGETVVALSGFSTPADGVAMTFVREQDEKAKSTGYLLVASHSREVTGLLLLHKVPVLSVKKGGNTTEKLSQDHTAPFQTQYLSTPASSLDFSLSSNNLLLADKTGTIRIYSPDVADGSWLLTLHTDFLKSDTAKFSSRKAILDTKWVLGGKAVMALLSDGEWGVWDLEGSGPGAPRGILGSQGIKGGALTPFSISGYIDGPSIKSTSRPAASTSKFAPMTPAARRTVEPALLGSHNQSAAAGLISALPLPKTTTTSPPDERIAFWIEDAYAVIPSLRAFWEAQHRRGANLFSGASGTKMIRIDNINLRGERCTGLAQSVIDGANPELIIAGEHRLVIVADLPESGGAQRPRASMGLESGAGQLQIAAPSGMELDITGIDQMLDRMDEDGSPSLFAKRKSIQT
ncbi:hypothetical protein V494_02048 [Pseudogymnoascus sp. VKM F-4513 (FW-928)]|nr:hypothetical protein V494_02048 [Pseudogymnoascus sp. VKM F-4513 (FW-928)]